VLIALGITAITIGTITYSVSYLNRARVAELDSIQQQLSIDALSLETQFSLLEFSPCSETVDSTNPTITGLTSKLDDMGRKLSYAEDQLGTENKEVQMLKLQYSLLEIRDYLITQKIELDCKSKAVTVLYFYSNGADCSDCTAAGDALSYLHNTYPDLRVYSFDYHLDLGALATLKTQIGLKDELPAFVINGQAHYGFTTLADLEAAFPKGTLATSTATGTAASLKK
jgi:hypothetical protein